MRRARSLVASRRVSRATASGRHRPGPDSLAARPLRGGGLIVPCTPTELGPSPERPTCVHDLIHPHPSEDIVMAPFCIHHCLHMHSRWSAMHRDKHLLGFDGFTPNRVPGAPTVPSNQTVFASFPDRRSLRYRAVAESAAPGRWRCFLHHGFGYVIDAWPAPVLGPLSGDALFTIIKKAVEAGAAVRTEPHPRMPGDGDGWARVYWRLRYGGRLLRPAERLTFDLAECLR
jgi:hypothetical protein